MPPIPVPPMGRARPTDGRCRSRGTRRKWLPTVFHYVADQRTEPTCKPRCCLGRAGGSPRFELELQLGPPLLVGLLGQAKIGLSGADLLDGAPERVETQGIDAALIQPYSGHASRESLVEIYSRLPSPTRPAQLRQRHRPLPRLKDPPIGGRRHVRACRADPDAAPRPAPGLPLHRETFLAGPALPNVSPAAHWGDLSDGAAADDVVVAVLGVGESESAVDLRSL